MKRKTFTKTALTLSICLLVLWGIFGTSASIAWFMDTTPVKKNSFIIGELDMVVSHKVGDTYKVVEEGSSIFDDEALYEPGYVQVVYLKIENKGDVDFDYKLSVDKFSYIDSINVYGTTLHLPDHLKFGAVFADTESELDRELAKGLANIPFNSLNTYSSDVDTIIADSEDESIKYAALIIRMPEEVGNEANYRGITPPSVELGITVLASQKGTLS